MASSASCELASRLLKVSRNHPLRIRNVSIIAHVDHGKTTLTDHLLGDNGIIGKSSAGSIQFMDSRQDEMDRLITINASSVSLFFSPQRPVTFAALNEGSSAESTVQDSSHQPYSTSEDVDQEHLINIIDCPGHQDFLSEVHASLQVSDGSLIVVDAVEGVKAQTRAVLSKAWQQGCSVVLFINKMDRLFEELMLSPQEAYAQLETIFQDIGSLIGEFLQSEAIRTSPTSSTTEIDDAVEAAEVPEFTRGRVLIGSAKQGWGTSIISFAEIFKSRVPGLTDDIPTICKHLWGPSSYNKGEFVAVNSPKKCLGVSFVMKLLHGIYENWDSPEELLPSATMMMNVKCPNMGSDQHIQFLEQVSEMHKSGSFPYSPGESLLRKCFPLPTAVMQMLCWRLPPPSTLVESKFRWSRVNRNVTVSHVLKLPLVAYSPRSVAVNLKSKKIILDCLRPDESDVVDFLAITRIIHGSLSVGDALFVRKWDFESVEIKVTSIFVFMGTDLVEVASATSGMVVGIGFISTCEQDINGGPVYGVNTKVIANDVEMWVKSMVLHTKDKSQYEADEAVNYKIWTDIRDLTFSSSTLPRSLGSGDHGDREAAVMKVKLSCAIDHRAVLRTGLWRLVRTDPSVRVDIVRGGDMIIAVNGAIQLEKVIKDLSNVLARCPFTTGDPSVDLCETVVSIRQAEQDWTRAELLKGIITPDGPQYRQNLISLDDDPNLAIPFPPWAPPGRQTRSQSQCEESMSEFSKNPSNFIRKSYKGGSAKGAACSAVAWVVTATSLDDKADEELHLLHRMEDDATGLRARLSIAKKLDPRLLKDGGLKENIDRSLCLLHPSAGHSASLVSVVADGWSRAFQRLSPRGPIMGGPLRNVHFVVEAVLLEESLLNSDMPQESCRAMGDAISKCFHKTLSLCMQLRGRIRVYEPMMGITVNCNQLRLGLVHKVLDQRRCQKFSEEYEDGTSEMRLDVMIPLCEMSGLLQDVRSETKGLVHVESDSRSAWRLIETDPFPEGAMTREELEDAGETLGTTWAGNRARQLVLLKRESVGLPTGKKIVKDAEKQRTMTKMK
eukprot:GHVH01014010.1.p1 GENE.GHVH01014010.1~~GHVH01014010.1.p1  ORF type:complete len:1063 (-),score=182.43 GHVH01014010.1:2707-5895(-)